MFPSKPVPNSRAVWHRLPYAQLVMLRRLAEAVDAAEIAVESNDRSKELDDRLKACWRNLWSHQAMLHRVAIVGDVSFILGDPPDLPNATKSRK